MLLTIIPERSYIRKMKMKANFKRGLLCVSALAMSLSCLTSCGKYGAQDLINADVTGFANEADVRDYYIDELKFDSIAVRTADLKTNDYELQTLEDPEKEAEVRDAIARIEEVLSEDEYEIDKKTNDAKLISQSDFDYIKANIDGYALSNGAIQDIKTALGYYFVDVEFDVKPQSTGTFLPCSDLLGINGAWKHLSNTIYDLDTGFVNIAITLLNKYYYLNEIDRMAKWDPDDQVIKIYNSENNTFKVEVQLDNGDESDTQFTMDPNTLASGGLVNVDEGKNNGGGSTTGAGDKSNETSQTESTSSDTGSTDTTTGGDSSTDTTTTTGDTVKKSSGSKKSTAQKTSKEAVLGDEYIPEIPSNSVIDADSDRRVRLDINLINEQVGSSTKEMAFLPDLNLVYEKPKKDGEICGFGIYPEGSNALRIFDYDRSAIAGKLKISFVFKDQIENAGVELVKKNMYVSSIDITNGFSAADNKITVNKATGDYLTQTIERMDRVEANSDIGAMMTNKLYEDKGYATLAAFKKNCSYQNKRLSTIRNILATNTANKAYLLEVETIVEDMANGSEAYGTFRDRSYVVVQLMGADWLVTDSVRVSRETMREPEVEPDSAAVKRLIAMNLYGAVPEDVKPTVKELLLDMYKSATELRRTPDEENGIKGLDALINSNTSILSATEKDYIINYLASKLTAHGTGNAVISGSIIDWMGGSETQVEFETEELITYAGYDEGYYMRVHYVVSKQDKDGSWVIDERTVAKNDGYTVEGEMLDAIKGRLGME